MATKVRVRELYFWAVQKYKARYVLEVEGENHSWIGKDGTPTFQIDDFARFNTEAEIKAFAGEHNLEIVGCMPG